MTLSYGVLHIPFHFLIPFLVVKFWGSKRDLILMLSANLIDLDHLLADPIFVADRCSLTTHPLHSPAAIACYVALLLPRSYRAFGVGALIHITLDGVGCIVS